MDLITNTSGVILIQEERIRQINVEGFDMARDIKLNARGQLVSAALAFAAPPKLSLIIGKGVELTVRKEAFFPSSWSPSWFKLSPDNRIKELVKAGALIAAEIDRLLKSPK